MIGRSAAGSVQERVVDASIRHRRAVLVCGALLFLLCVPGLLRLRPDNTPERFFPRSGEERQVFTRFESQFGSAAALRVVEPTPPPGSASPSASSWHAAQARVGALPAVLDLLGPASIAPGVDDRDQWRERPLGRALGWVGSGGEASAVALVDPARERLALEQLEDAALAGDAAQGQGAAYTVVGLASLSRALDASAREVMERSLPLLLLAATGLLALVLRDRMAIVVPIVFVAACEVALFGVLGWAGASLHLVLAVLPPLIFVIALATAVHLTTAVRNGREAGEESFLHKAFDEKGRAIRWATMATASGFGSLAASEVGPVRDLGLGSLLGIGLVALFAFTLLPAMLAVATAERSSDSSPAERDRADPRSKSPSHGVEGFLYRLGCRTAEGSVRRFGWVLLVTAALAVAAGVGFTRLTVESNALKYLPPTDPTRLAIERLDRIGLGSAVVELSVDRPAGRFDTGAGLQFLGWLAIRLREETEALRVLSASDWVEEALRSEVEAAAREGRGIGAALGGSAAWEAALVGLRGDARGRRALDSFLTADGQTARISLFVATGGIEDLDRLTGQVSTILAEECAECRMTVTGRYPLVLATQRRLLSTLGRSLALTLIVVSLILYLLLGRFRLTLLALVPNALPVVLIFGAMGWAGVPLDIATVMVASTTLGLALDDTIHTLVHFRRRMASGDRPVVEALLETVERNAVAYSTTGLVLFLGFLACATSSFEPIRRFGLLSAGSIALAVGADFLLVPALLGGAPRSLVVRTRRAEE